VSVLNYPHFFISSPINVSHVPIGKSVYNRILFAAIRWAIWNEHDNRSFITMSAIPSSNDGNSGFLDGEFIYPFVTVEIICFYVFFKSKQLLFICFCLLAVLFGVDIVEYFESGEVYTALEGHKFS